VAKNSGNPGPQEVQVRYRSFSDVSKYHGPIVLVLYWLTQIVSWITITYLWLNLPRWGFCKSCALDQTYNKPKPWWQDLAVLISILLTVLALLMAWHGNSTIEAGAWWLGFYVLLDSIAYYVRVLWFDDIVPNITDEERKVWSHRRILFQAVINYLQSMLLFTVFRRGVQPSDNLEGILFKSVEIAVTLEPIEHNAVTVAQIAVSLFFIVVVVSVMVSIGYRRKEIAPGPEA
jgi:hypothetical protein